ncbi:MAG TPA: BMP family ABC transporter substrate-binding protein [Actinomycetota bacterium]|nr:BMP family ABC transporter substrate-binding protein [Actinomycetota bacterium]
MDYRILGSLEVTADGSTLDLGPPKQRALMAILVLNANEIVPTDRLIDLLWAERAPRTAGHSVQIYVSQLRKVIEPQAGDQLIVTHPPGYRLHADPESIDARRFERLVAEAARDLRAGDTAAGAGELRAALSEWRGPALAEFAYEEFAQAEIRRLTDLRLAALEDLAAAELDAGRPQQVQPLVEAAIREDPLRERPRELLMRALYRTGRHAEALRAYQAFRTQLADDLGLDPSPALQRLQERILLHDPALAPDRVEPAPEPAPARNPYKGLRPFGEDDAEDFFGRTALVDQILRALRDGARLVSLVGPSGSGKSSVVAAGLIPRVRAGEVPGSERWVITSMVPGQRPLDEVEIALAEAASWSGSQGSLGRLIGGVSLRMPPGAGPVLLVIDQFEEVFSITEEPGRGRFLRALAEAVSEPSGPLSVVLTLRADFYGGPLLHPEFAEVFTPSVMNVLPLTTIELEQAVLGPAERVGLEIEPPLLAELILDTVGQPGALPLLQYALTELCEQRSGRALALDGYRSMGGLRGALTRRAEELYAGLDPHEQEAAMQVFLRLVRVGHGTEDARRRVPISELTALDLDPVALSEVLERFGRHRLLSFDRDASSGHAMVEVAHEALLWEWGRLARWVEKHRAGLRKHDAFVTAADEWETSGRNPDYLLTGTRLTEYESWSKESALQLTARERGFLEASLDRRREEEAEEVSRRDLQRRLERRARTRLLALMAAVILFVGASTYGILTWLGDRPPQVLVVDSRASGIFGDLVSAGVDRAASEFGIRAERVLPTEERAGQRARLTDVSAYSERGADVLITIGNNCTVIDPVARRFPEIRYVAFDCWGSVPNVAYVSFAGDQGSYLAGAAAALTSDTDTIGFVGGADFPLIWAFQAGFEAGARAVDPTIEVKSVYLSEPPDFSGFDSQPRAFEAAWQMYEDGADVIFHAAGPSGFGVFEAALQQSRRNDRHVWAIGVDIDQYVLGDPHAPFILTSMVKRYDEAVYRLLVEYARGQLRTGVRYFDLASGGVGLTYSGGFIDHLRPELERLQAEIVASKIDVPCVPADRQDRLDELVDWGLDPDDPCGAPGG